MPRDTLSEKSSYFVSPSLSSKELSTATTRIMTIDLEWDQGSKQSRSMEEVVPYLLDFFKQEQITATFFTVSSLLDRYEDELKELAKSHEIASHSKTHSMLTTQNMAFEIGQSKRDFESFGISCLGFRAPCFVTATGYQEQLRKQGYFYDSSITSVGFQRLPSKPYTDKYGLVEFPMANSLWPFVNHSLQKLKVFHPVSNYGLSSRKLLYPISKFSPPKYMFYFHPWELLDRFQLAPAKGLFGHLLQRNTGSKARKIFEEFVRKDPSVSWISCQEYLRKTTTHFSSSFPHKR